jgi:hypothetical protein
METNIPGVVLLMGGLVPTSTIPPNSSGNQMQGRAINMRPANLPLKAHFASNATTR